MIFGGSTCRVIARIIAVPDIPPDYLQKPACLRLFPSAFMFLFTMGRKWVGEHAAPMCDQLGGSISAQLPRAVEGTHGTQR